MNATFYLKYLFLYLKFQLRVTGPFIIAVVKKTTVYFSFEHCYSDPSREWIIFKLLNSVIQA